MCFDSALPYIERASPKLRSDSFQKELKISAEISRKIFALENQNKLLLMVKLFTINTKIKCKTNIFTLKICFFYFYLLFLIIINVSFSSFSKKYNKMILLCAAAITAALVIFYYVQKQLSYWSSLNVDGPTPLPFFGNMLPYFQMKKHFGEVYDDIYK